MNASSIELRGLTKRYGKVLAADGVSISLGAGKVLALLGPSGSGKSTVLNLLAGFETPDAGSILVDGQDVASLPPERRAIAIVFQNYALFPHLSIEENLAYPLRRRSVGGAERARRITRTLELVRLGGYGHRRTNELSGGQQQRVALARALIAEPKILLLDEPLAALDKALRDDLQVELKALQARVGSTVIIVTHDQNEALALAHEIGVINQGVVQQQGMVQEVFENPASAFVARFLGGASLISGRVRVDGGDIALELQNGSTLPGRWMGSRAPRQGDRAELAIRPSRISVQKGGNYPLDAVIYGGDASLFHVSLGEDQSVIARHPHDADLNPGDRVSVSWDARHGHIFPIA